MTLRRETLIFSGVMVMTLTYSISRLITDSTHWTKI